MKPEVHNPDNLTPEEYGASDGWRLLYKDEDKPGDAQVYTTSRRWRHAYCALPVVQEKTYRTRTPDPYAEPVKPNASSWTKMSERKPTEAEKDEEAFARGENETESRETPREAWYRAIRYERAEIAKLVEQYFYNDGTDIECLRAIRARVEGAHD